MLTLDQGIGPFKLAKRQIFNPITWIVYVIHLPIAIIEKAGLMGRRPVHIEGLESTDVREKPDKAVVGFGIKWTSDPQASGA
jgi:hypothetical protein